MRVGFRGMPEVTSLRPDGAELLVKGYERWIETTEDDKGDG